MKILQLVDSLTVGGTERMSVNIANLLSNDDDSFLCTTRGGGELNEQIDKKVIVLELNKKSFYDFATFYKLLRFIKKNNIQVIHCHSSSVYWGILIKVFTKVVLVYHDHCGMSEQLNIRNLRLAKIVFRFSDHVIVVNELLLNWYSSFSNKNKKATYLSNFSDFKDLNSTVLDPHVDAVLSKSNDQFIICLANLRPQKNHQLLFDTLVSLKDELRGWKILLAGNDPSDEYSRDLLLSLNSTAFLKENVVYLGKVKNVKGLLDRCSIGVLSSLSEGLPVSLLEYGQSRLAVISTNVGQVKDVIPNDTLGFLSSCEKEIFLNDFKKLISLSNEDRQQMGGRLFEFCLDNFSSQSFKKRITQIYSSLIKV